MVPKSDGNEVSKHEEVTVDHDGCWKQEEAPSPKLQLIDGVCITIATIFPGQALSKFY